MSILYLFEFYTIYNCADSLACKEGADKEYWKSILTKP
jgi:hypothetical protein